MKERTVSIKFTCTKDTPTKAEPCLGTGILYKWCAKCPAGSVEKKDTDKPKNNYRDYEDYAAG